MHMYATPVLLDGAGLDEDVSEVAPLLVVGAVALAGLILRMGSAAAVAKWVCSPRAVSSFHVTWYGALEVRCR